MAYTSLYTLSEKLLATIFFRLRHSSWIFSVSCCVDLTGLLKFRSYSVHVHVLRVCDLRRRSHTYTRSVGLTLFDSIHAVPRRPNFWSYCTATATILRTVSTLHSAFAFTELRKTHFELRMFDTRTHSSESDSEGPSRVDRDRRNFVRTFELRTVLCVRSAFAFTEDALSNFTVQSWPLARAETSFRFSCYAL